MNLCIRHGITSSQTFPNAPLLPGQETGHERDTCSGVDYWAQREPVEREGANKPPSKWCLSAICEQICEATDAWNAFKWNDWNQCSIRE